jgi:AAA domain
MSAIPANKELYLPNGPAPEIPGADSAANDNNDTEAPPKERRPAYPGLTHSGEFVRDFTPPDYHIDGVAQAGFLYSTTAMTGTGKTAWLLQVSAQTMLGGKLGDRDVRKGRVIYFVGENPDDVRMRWIAMSHAMGFDPGEADVYFMLGAFSIPEMFFRIKKDVERLGGAEMIVIDTSAAYFQGDDDNSNTQLGNHARDLRQLTTLPGRPVVFVASHPIKNADTSNLLPRGGGAFLNEVDGNLTLVKKAGLVEFHWQGKFRGPDFEPIYFALKPVTTPALMDSKGRLIPSVMAECVDSGEVKERARDARDDADSVLLKIDLAPHQSLADIAESLGWKTASGEPDKERARRACDRLEKAKLISLNPSGRGRKLSKAGREALVEIRADRFKAERAARVAANVVATAQDKRVDNRVEHESWQHDNTAA